MPNCALCLQDRGLQRSHVIPEFMYTPMYDDKHRFQVISTTNPAREHSEQKGLREKLLCNDCESQLSVHERYVSQVLSGAISVQATHRGDLVSIEGLNYKHFRLFGLSVLWRAGVSRHAFFGQVRLGPHEETLRKLIEQNAPGLPSQYGFFLAPIVHNDRNVRDLMVQPTNARLGGHYCYRFVFGGLVWVFVVSSHSPPQVFRDAFINPEGKMLMLRTELPDLPFIHRTMKKIFESR